MTDPTRRKFIARSLALGCSAAASPLMTPVTFASVPGDKRLVVIVLRGGMDGLGVVSPVGDPLFKGYRPSIVSSDFLDLDGYFALHPTISGLMPLWKAGELAFVHAVSTPYRNKRSHFDGQDLLEAGLMDTGSNRMESGWVNRLLAQFPTATKETAFSVGRENMLLLRGPERTMSWAPEGRIDLSPQAQLLLQAIYEKDPLFAEAGATAMTLAAQNLTGSADAKSAVDGQQGAMMDDVVENMIASKKAQKAEDLARFAARRLKEDTRLAAFSIGGWDTHQKQGRSINGALRNLQSSILELKQELGPVWSDTAVVCVTEFGRTVRENGSEGTDHGTGGAMVLAGGAVQGGKVHANWPGLQPENLFADRDLMPTDDVRRYLAWLARDLFGVEKAILETMVFPGVDMAGNPHLTA